MEFPERNKISNKPSKAELLKKKYQQKICWKPEGIWYSYYDSWYNWIMNVSEIKSWLYKFLYQINLKDNIKTSIYKKDKNKLLVIDNNKDFDIFFEKYKYNKKLISIGKCQNTICINWKKVSKDYGGIEIIPYLEDKREIDWYYTWDVASGCIWNKKLLQNIVLIGKNENNKYIWI